MFEDGGDVLGRDVAAACVEEGSYEVADHVVEEAVASDFVDEQVWFFSPFGREDGSDIVGLQVRVGLAGG